MQWFISTTFHPADLISSLRADAVNFIIENDYSWKKMWKAQKDRSAVTCINCHAVQQSVAACSQHNTVEVANSPPHQLCIFSRNWAENGDDHANTHTFHTIVLRGLKLPAVHPEQQVDRDGWELHNDDAPFSPMIPVIFSSAFFHPSPSWFWMILVETNLLSVTQFPRL